MACSRSGDESGSAAFLEPPPPSHKQNPNGAAVAAEPMPMPMPVPTSASASASQEWRSWEQLEASPPSISPTHWDSEDEEDLHPGPRPSELYGKFTWKIESFSQITKRELRSNVFDVGGYRWYILVYPQGCDVCNHLSLFLCVADYDKLLPGWSHFAQFTIAVVNKDPKKSKYSDTLHRFCKKEHDWGWKKFMELSKILDGFIVADTLVIKAQVQVIRENANRPFRCLDCQYRRELIRVYLTNVETICRRFVEEKREKLSKLIEDNVRWSSFRAFWLAVEESLRRSLAREKTDVILKAVVKRFFNEKEVTSTLVMDALYSGCKALDYRSKNKKGKINGVELEETINPVVLVDKDSFVLADDVLLLLERAATESLPPYKDDKGPQIRTKEGGSGDDFGKDSVERDEKRLTELGMRTIEIFVLAHLFSNRVEVAYREAVALKRQEELIREEEAAGQAGADSKSKRETTEKEKRAKKKQVKQRRNKSKVEEKEADDKGKRVKSQSESERYERLLEADDTSSAGLDMGLNAEASSSNRHSMLLDTDTVILSLRERIQWLEQRLAEKEEEVVLLQERLSLYPHHLGNNERAPVDEQSSLEEAPDLEPELSSPSNLSSGKDDCSSLKDAFPATDSGLRGVQSADTRGPLITSNTTDSFSTTIQSRAIVEPCSSVRNEHCPLPQAQLMSCPLPSSPSRNSAEFSVSASAIPATALSSSMAIPPRPSSAPVLVVAPCPTLPTTSRTPLARSASVTSRPALNSTEAFSLGDASSSQSTPSTPCRNSPGKSWLNNSTQHPSQIASATTGTSNIFSHTSSVSYKSSSSFQPPSTPPDLKISSNCGTVLAPLAASSKSEVALEKDSHTLPAISSGLTFGSITPEMLYAQQQQQLQNQEAESDHSYAQSNSKFLNNVKFHRMDVPLYPEHYPQHPPENYENYPNAEDFLSNLQHLVLSNEHAAHQAHAYQLSHSRGRFDNSPMKQGLSPIGERMHVGSVSAEEFPHLDIINDLLDDDKKMGKALSAYWLQPDAQGLNHQFSFEDLQRMNAGRLHMEMNSVHGDVSDRSDMMMMMMPGDEDHLALHGSENCSGNALRDSMQMMGPFSHSALPHAFGQQSGLLEGIPRQHWSAGNVSIQNTNSSLNGGGLRRGGLDAQIGYPLQSHHIPLAQCPPPYSLGHNGYTVYAPMEQP